MTEPTTEEIMTTAPLDLVTATKEIIVAYVAHNNLSEERVSTMIESVHQSLRKIAGEAAQPEETVAAAPTQDPAVPIKKSIHPDYIVCLEDGKRLKVMTRYLSAKFNMTPDDYRRKWGLPADYPMTAPNYSKQRSEMARGMGLGKVQKGKKVVARGAERLSQEG